jgi:hypothetical protein
LKSLTIIFVFFLSYSAFAQQDTVVVKDFENEWYYFDGKQQLPLVRKSDFEGNRIYFRIDVRDYKNSLLLIKSSQEVSIFVEDILFQVFEGSSIIKINDLKSQKGIAKLTIYTNSLNPYFLKTKILKIVESKLDPVKDDVVIVNLRNERLFNNFFIISLVILVGIFAALINFYPRVITEFFKISRAVSLRESDENLLKGRAFTGINILIYAYISLLISFLIFSFIFLARAFPQVEIFYPTSFFGALWTWIRIAMMIFVAIILKYSIIAYFSNLFDISGFANNHFINFVRLILIISHISLFILVLVNLSSLELGETSLFRFFISMVFSLVIISIIIYLKLMRSAPFKNLHLFSYLCATELIPFVIILSLGINKSF